MIIIGISPSVQPLHHESGRKLLSQMLERFLGIRDAIVTVDERGKPHVEGAEFSISHSSGLVMCSLFVPGDIPALPLMKDGAEISVCEEMFFAAEGDECLDIGADIEMIDRDREEERLRTLADRYYSEGECELVYKNGEIRENFYRVWTEKESYLKLTGEGLSGIRRADTSSLGNGILRISFRILYEGEKYSLSICARGR